MPSYTRNRAKDTTTFVEVTPVILYGFSTFDIAGLSGVSLADIQNNLGHMAPTAAAGLAGRIRVIGANAPKPSRVQKRLSQNTTNQQGSVSTFCAFNRLTQARTNDWKLVKKGNGVPLTPQGSTTKKITAIAALDSNALYCFPMNAQDYATYGQTLGLQTANNITTAERNRLVAGSTTPKPARARLRLPDGSFFSSFVSTSAINSAISAGFAISGTEIA